MRIGILKGNGIGPEITQVTQRALEATGISLDWQDILVADGAIEKYGHPLPSTTLSQVRSIGRVIKAPLIVDKLKGRINFSQEDGSCITYPSLNNAIRRELGVFVNLRPIRGFPGISGRHESLNIIIMREVTEDVYAGLEHTIGNDVAAEAIKLTTRAASTRIAKFSFDYARQRGRKRVTCLHKANVLNLTDGLFLRCFYEVSKDYADIEVDDMMIDAACYAIVRDPRRFDVLVMSNQYGDIFSDLASGLVGSLGLAPGVNIGDNVSMFEACHGAAPDIAGKGIANPLALILSGALLLEEAGHGKKADVIRRAVEKVIKQGNNLTPDLGGSGTTESLTDVLIDEINQFST